VHRYLHRISLAEYVEKKLKHCYFYLYANYVGILRELYVKYEKLQRGLYYYIRYFDAKCLDNLTEPLH